MATIINNPDSSDSSGGGMGMVIGAIVLVVILILFFVYGLPALRGNNSTRSVDVNVTTPSTTTEAGSSTNQ